MAAPAHGWFIREWMKTLQIKQADFTRSLGWSKAKASDVVTGKQRYTQDLIEEVAKVMNVQPWELLMHPHDAMSLRRMREAAISIAAEARPDETEADTIRRAG